MTSADLAGAMIALLIETTLAGSAAIGLVLLVRGVVRRTFGAGLAYALWGLVPLAMAAAMLPAAARPQALGALPVVLAAGPVQALEGVDGSAPWPAARLLAGAWLLGAAALAALLSAQQRRFRVSLGRLVLRDDGHLQAQASAGLPAVLGAVRPRIVLPCDFEQRYDPEQQVLVLHHERTHIARGDARINALVAVLRCLHWFNPLLHFAAARFRQDQELACDARVIASHPHTRRRYGEAMLNTQLADAALPVGCHWSGSGRAFPHPLKERIAMLKNPLPSRSRSATGSFLLAGLALVTTLSAWALDIEPADTGPTEDVSYRRMSPPSYPPESLANREHGDVWMRVRVAADGSPAQVEVEKSSGSKQLDEAAMAAVRTWRFNPGIRDGQAVEGWVLVPISFRLNESAVPLPATPKPDGAPALDQLYVRPAASGGR